MTAGTESSRIPADAVFTADEKPSGLADMYRGRSCFLMSGGPSLAKLTKRQRRILSRPGFLTMGINNAVKVFRPNLWTCVDDPDHFIRSIFLDPRIVKFLPAGKREKFVFDSDAWDFTQTRIRDCPGVFYYRLTHAGFPGEYLSQRDFFWGFDGKDGGGRSVMHIPPKLLYYLGVRRIYLVGCDFRMSEAEKYAFEQDRSKGSIKGNNSTYAKLNERFAALGEQFAAAGLTIINCTDGSGLEPFPRMKLDKALDQVQDEFGVRVERERTYGLYQRNGGVKAIENWRKKAEDRTAEAAKLWREADANPANVGLRKAADRAVKAALNATKVSIGHENEAARLRFWPKFQDMGIIT